MERLFRCGVVCLLLAGAVPVHARTFTVTNVEDGGPGSLRQAVRDALPGDRIVFHPSLDARPLVLTGSPLVVDKALTIAGRGPSETIVDGGSNSGVFVTSDTVMLSGMTIRNGSAVSGGGIYNSGSLTLLDAVVADNVARDDGGGILNYWDSSLTISHVTIRDNHAGRWGGGISSAGSTFTVLHTTVSGNEAGYEGPGITSTDDMLTIRNSTIDSNRGRFGGLYLWTGRGAIVDETTICNNSRQGIYAFGAPIEVRNSCINDNGGVGIEADSDDLVLVNSTVSGNRGGVSSVFGSEAFVTESTITANSRQGIYSHGDGVILRRSIVANQSGGPDCHPDASVYSRGHNLDSDGSCHLNDPTDLPGTDPLLLPLGDGLGPTATALLADGSPAIDAAGTECESRDQRGVPRPVDGDDDGIAECDIGAVEHLPLPGQAVGSVGEVSPSD